MILEHHGPIPPRAVRVRGRHGKQRVVELAELDVVRSVCCPACGREAERSDRTAARWVHHAVTGRAWECNPGGCGVVFALELREVRGGGRELAVERADVGLERAAREAAGRARRVVGRKR